MSQMNRQVGRKSSWSRAGPADQSFCRHHEAVGRDNVNFIWHLPILFDRFLCLVSFLRLLLRSYFSSPVPRRVLLVSLFVLSARMLTELRSLRGLEAAAESTLASSCHGRHDRSVFRRLYVCTVAHRFCNHNNNLWRLRCCVSAWCCITYRSNSCSQVRTPFPFSRRRFLYVT